MDKPIILIVDDEPEVLRAVERDLRRQYASKYRIMKAGSGADALQAARQLKARNTPVALFLSDQRMPTMTGTEFLGEARTLFPDARKVLLTAYADTEAAIQSINSIGLDHYLMKPWDPPEQNLYPVLDDLLDDWQATATIPFDGIRVVGTLWSPQSYVIKEFLSRNHVPYQWIDLDKDASTRALVDADDKLPVVLLPDGRKLASPELGALAEAVGMQTRAEKPHYDLVILGAGPAGLAAGVYAGSEGLKTVMIEKKAPGGQAGSSSFIENYLGFPKGLSGADLARRASTQARRFGVEIVSGEAVKVERRDPFRIVHLADGSELQCHALIIATGMTTRQLEGDGFDALTGRGIYYGASLTEASAYRGKDILIIGAANSAGQGALFFARFARKVTMLVRGASLEAGMSDYLVKQIRDTANIDVLLNTRMVQAHGEEGLEAVTIESTADNQRVKMPMAAAFVFIGTIPHSEMLGDVVERDQQGFVLTGADLLRDGKRPRGWTLKRDPLPLETSVPGVMAIGDVRHGSVKRVATSVGEGANSVSLVHQYLSTV